MNPVLVQSPGGHVRIWDHPVEGAQYVIGADVAEGKVKDVEQFRKTQLIRRDQRPDLSAAVVLEQQSGLHVATWHGYMEPLEYGQALVALGLYYNTALLVPEINGPGIAVIEFVNKVLEYPNLYRSLVVNQASTQNPLAQQWGFRTTEATRPLLIARVQEAITSQSAFTRDEVLVDECRTMEFALTGKPQASGNNKDDLVMAWGLALQGRYEALMGTVQTSESTEGDDLTYAERRIWEAVREERARRNDARSRGRTPTPVRRIGSRRRRW